MDKIVSLITGKPDKQNCCGVSTSFFEQDDITKQNYRGNRGYRRNHRAIPVYRNVHPRRPYYVGNGYRPYFYNQIPYGARNRHPYYYDYYEQVFQPVIVRQYALPETYYFPYRI